MRIVNFFLIPMISFVSSCFTNQTVIDYQYTTYQNNVYNISTYIHPGGQLLLSMSYGKNLEYFFNIPKYNFHTTSKTVINDLDTLYIGQLCN